MANAEIGAGVINWGEFGEVPGSGLVGRRVINPITHRDILGRPIENDSDFKARKRKGPFRKFLEKLRREGLHVRTQRDIKGVVLFMARRKDLIREPSVNRKKRKE